MQDIIIVLSEKAKACKAGEHFSFEIVDPDLGEGYAGETIEIEGTSYLCRSYKSWTDLAELLLCKMMTPEKGSYPLVTMRFKKLETQSSFHTRSEGMKEEKYGTASHFSQIRKMEEPAFLYYYTQALKNAKLNQRRRILNLGINKGDEFAVIKNTLDEESYEKTELVGVDHSGTAIAYAEERFPEAHVHFYVHDINDLESLNLGRFDLLISIGTLQSPGIHFKPFFMSLVQNCLENDAAVILGFPNSRWVGGEMLYGAKAPNYAMSEMSLLFNDVMFCKKYLQQKKYRVTLTGKQYIFLTATKII
ncbi:MAG TPA: class I SAM-dependent methyltransferase [Sulfurovum sp.]|uniref:class I SAM-dependent methyltransferase n=1 Tax=Sulfurovum sp. TaxID=1969726 RepID=UPI002F91CF62